MDALIKFINNHISVHVHTFYVSYVLPYILSTFSLPVLAGNIQMGQVSMNIFFGVFMMILFLPELGVILKRDFRVWVKNGIEDSDGKFNKSDLASLLIHYSTLWCTRMYVMFGLLEAFYGIKVRESFIVGSLVGAFGIEAIGFFVKSKITKDGSDKV